ncbi:hypothetical protein ANCCEY_13485 [Ancylostoma ceylanicum]|uniref:Uncharacterized protein n=1 Tax=Ancylostoma ceylanicum TaxID=53326 RepID=A0A0D6L7F3_9BILA|nr:hypothetical protein ANCCEY_13485 [Ancylostoma ceylanicum]
MLYFRLYLRTAFLWYDHVTAVTLADLMKDIDDFVFKNIQCSAICLAKFADELVPFLVKALGIVPQMKWVDDGLVNKNDRVPIQEQFAFCFNTVLSDLAALLPEYRDVIVNAQIFECFCSV